ncbi:odorant receptor 56a-like [Hermetia illucens]|uniref:odorant receptor 56a-like n=1 Tax=Hermetia illucens TaxID=343691 RepID=UPI0018CC42EA|nr:odorant receptor 56a-like [Hermetia illucens]
MNYTIIGPFIVAGLLVCSEGVYFIIHQSQQWTLQQQEENSTKAKGMNHLFVLYCTGSLSENFFFTFILPYYMVLIGGYSLFTWQTFNVAIMRYISFRIDVVKFRLENISKYAGNLLKELHPNKNRKLAPSHPILLKYVLVSCVEDLTEIKCFAGDYEYVSNVTVFIESSTTSALLCGQLYIMTKDCTGIYALWSVVTIGMLWNYYWHANEILYKSHEITNALYSFNWYAVPPSLQKDIAIFMGASMRSIIMKSGFIYVNMHSFFKILTTSYRYFTLLRNFAK